MGRHVLLRRVILWNLVSIPVEEEDSQLHQDQGMLEETIPLDTDYEEPMWDVHFV
jgi:hypothetical protein